MAKARKVASLVASSLLLVNGTIQAAPTIAQMLGFRPKQEGIQYSSPAAADVDRCKVELVKEGRGSGWLLKDAAGQPLRRYYDSNGDNKIDIWSYYHQGQEVYREIDSNYNDRVDHYRWLHSGGSKHGVDVNEDGKIDAWKQISPEELSQEVLKALASRDLAAFQALWPSEAEQRELPAAEASRLQQTRTQARARFDSAAAKVPAGAKWIHLELPVPQAIVADGRELVKYPGASLLYQAGDKSEWLQLGELIQVGQGYRITEGPVPGMGHDVPEAPNAEIQPLLVELQKIDSEIPNAKGNADLARLYFSRSNVLERIIGKAKPAERDQWVQQLADCLNMVVQNTPKGDDNAHKRLAALQEQTAKASPGSNLAAYVSYCEIQAENAIKTARTESKEMPEVQKQYIEKLARFVQDYPKADNTPDALMQLGMMSELAGDEGPAKKWFEMLAANFPSHMYAKKAAGAVTRLGLKGRELALSGMVLGGGAFDIRSLKGKTVVVYYWASWNGQSAQDFAKLKEQVTKHAGKVAVVCVNLDDEEAEARNLLAKVPAPGVVLFERGGQHSRLADQYGVVVLPTLFLVDKDGKVLNHNLQIGLLEEELKKALN